MWRFILVSFAFLGLAFYIASGGASYAPAPNSLQVALRDKPFFAPPRAAPAPVEIADIEKIVPPVLTPKPKAEQQSARSALPEPDAPEPAALEPATPENSSYAGLSALWPETTEEAIEELDITLAPPLHRLNGGDAMQRRPIERIGSFDAETLVNDVSSVPIEQAVIATQPPADIRQIVSEAANMRSGPGTDFAKVEQLPRGASVEVLDRRGAWVNLRDVQTGQTGWMADWLISAAQ